MNLTEETELPLVETASIAQRLERMGNPNFLSTMSMTELYQKTFDAKPAIIENLLYAGAYILAGAPKIGKSFLVAQIAYHVSTGIPLWGFEVNQGTVLYLALEDDYQRIQNRMFKMYGIEDSPFLHFSIAASKVGSGLDLQLENFMRDHPDTRLMIIDTMQKIREAGSDTYSYASDYEVIGHLKSFASTHGICILIVHHTRKMPAGDSFDMISGTTGLLGCADGSLLMQKKKRTALEATIDVVGRDQQDQILYLIKQPDTQIWELDHTETELYKEPPDPILEAVANLITPETPQWCNTATALVSELGLDISASVLSKHLNIQSGKLQNEYHIKYENRATHARREIQLTYLADSPLP